MKIPSTKLSGKLQKVKDLVANRPREDPHVPPSVSRISKLDRSPHVPIDMAPWEKPNCSLRLRPIQKEALGAIRDMGGAFLPIGVGWGKTFIELLAPVVANKKIAIILAPQATLDNVNNELTVLHRHYYMPSVVYEVMSYGVLSRSDPNKPETFDKLHELIRGYREEDVILLCDESHKLANLKTSARVHKVVRFIAEHPKVSVVMLSGSMTKKSIMDYHHLLLLALRGKTPLPLAPQEIKKWSRVLDVESRGRAKATDFNSLAEELKRYDPRLEYQEGKSRRTRRAREAFATHLLGARGVVGTLDERLDTRLNLHRIMGLQGFDKSIREVYKLVQETGESPDGEEVYGDPARMAAALRQISMGFFYRWVWPDGEIDFEWLETRATFNRLMRYEILSNRTKGYDSPLMVEAVIVKEPNKNKYLYEALIRWNEHRHKKDPPVEAVWLTTRVMEDCVEWCQDTLSSLWYISKAVADKVEELGMVTHRSGDRVQKHLGEYNFPQAWSVRSHGTGLNMQGYSRALLLESPTEGDTWEQYLGRLHRPHQQASTVEFFVLQHTPVLQRSLRTAIQRAKYINQTYTKPQRLLICNITKTESLLEANQYLNRDWR